MRRRLCTSRNGTPPAPSARRSVLRASSRPRRPMRGRSDASCLSFFASRVDLLAQPPQLLLAHGAEGLVGQDLLPHLLDEVEVAPLELVGDVAPQRRAHAVHLLGGDARHQLRALLPDARAEAREHAVELAARAARIERLEELLREEADLHRVGQPRKIEPHARQPDQRLDVRAPQAEAHARQRRQPRRLVGRAWR